MSAPKINALPTTPSRLASPSSFSTDVDAFYAALPNFVADANALAAYINGGLSVVSNVVGTASQTNGVPTGAIMETGSNANGIYARWANGWQVCSTGTIIDQSIPAGTYVETTWTYPAQFVGGSLYQVNANVRSTHDAASRENAARYLRVVASGDGAASSKIGVFNSHTSALTARVAVRVMGLWATISV